MNQRSIRRGLTVLLLLLSVLPAPAVANTTAQFWEEIGGSGNGPGISASELGVVPEHRNTSMVIDADGRPIVAYADWADIVVRRWNGAEWEVILAPGGGHLPQLVKDANGKIYLGWMHFVPELESWEVYLLARDPATGDWSELSGSFTGGGISAADGRANANSFSLAIGPDGTPWVAYDMSSSAGVDFTTTTSGVAVNSQQIYVKRWSGPTEGWVYVGSDRSGGGATGVPSFVFTNADGSANFALHGALSPTLAIRPDATPVLAFLYTSDFQTGKPAEFNGLNDDVYAITWTGGAWVPMGPAAPATAEGAGLGGPGGISNDNGWSLEGFINRLNRPYVIIGRDGAPVLGWGETSDADGFRRMFVRRWNGTTWTGLGSASGELAMSQVLFDISLAPGVNGPIAAWSGGGGSNMSIFVLGWDATLGRWTEIGIGSGSGTGISGAQRRDHTPWITVDAAGMPSVTWIQAPDVESSGQTLVRTFEPRTLADLQVTAVSAPATTRTGGTIAVTSTVRNVGMQPSPSVPLTFYLSTGTTHGPGDVRLGGRTVAAMAVNGTSTAATSLTLPGSVDPGTYHVLAVVDEANTATERNENNNVGASAAMSVTIFRPELSFGTFSVPATGATGRTLAITNTVRNTGPAPAGAFTVRFYLSSDETVDASDVVLGSRTIMSLAAGASNVAVTTVTVPAQTAAPATYRIIGVVDADNQQTELDETNNTAVSGPVALSLYRPDLVMTALTTPATGATGRPLAITSTVKNNGPAPATAFSVRFYLSSDDGVDAGDVVLGARMLGGLAPGVSSTAVTSLTIPANTSAPASYRIIAVADALEQQVETDESNNTLVSPAAVAISLYRPDLAMTALTMPATGAAGRPLAITSTVKNNGPAPATAFSVRFYLSSDGALDPGDVLLGARMLGGLAPGASSTAVTSVTIPANTSAPATYRLVAVADALEQQVETDESNNTLVSAASITISLYRPDLVVSALTMPALGAAGRPLAITSTVRNDGPAPATGFTVRFYLSADDALDAGDVLLGARMLASLAAGASSTAVTSVTIPANTPVPATYRIIAVADALDQQVETDEANNTTTSSSTINVTLYRPDLVVTALGAPASGAAGRTLAVSNTVTNAGPAPATAFGVRFYLSTDGVLDEGDVLLGTRSVGGLASGATSAAVTALMIPANTSVPVTYRILAVVDALGQQTETDETNNVMATSAGTLITAYQPELRATAVSAPAGATAGHTLAVAHTVTNAGPAPAGAFTVKFYLSADDAFDAGDVLLGARGVAGLAAGASSAATTVVTVPAGTVVPDPYRVIAVVDALGQQAELDESNNVTASGPLAAGMATASAR